jgi:hypothetical protein
MFNVNCSGKKGIIKFVKKRKRVFFFFSEFYEQNGLEIIDIVADHLSCLVMNERGASKYVFAFVGAFIILVFTIVCLVHVPNLVLAIIKC